MEERKKYPVFCDGNFCGWKNMDEIDELRQEARGLAQLMQENNPADHMIYGYYSIHADGSPDTIRLYSGLPKTDTEFEEISKLRNAHIYAIHKSK